MCLRPPAIVCSSGDCINGEVNQIRVDLKASPLLVRSATLCHRTFDLVNCIVWMLIKTLDGLIGKSAPMDLEVQPRLDSF